MRRYIIAIIETDAGPDPLTSDGLSDWAALIERRIPDVEVTAYRSLGDVEADVRDGLLPGLPLGLSEY